MSSNETISSGDCLECVYNRPNQSARNAENYESVLKYSLANNDLIISNIFKWLKPSQLIKCSDVCLKWRHFAQLISYKRKSFSHKLLYFGLLSTGISKEFIDKYRNVFSITFEELADSFNGFVLKNSLMEFNVIIVFSKLDFNQFRQFLAIQCTTNDTTIIHINCRNEIIGSQIQSQQPLEYIECEPDFDLLSGISSLFISTTMIGIEVNVYEDSKVLDIQMFDNLKCILVFHMWRSFFSHFSRLKTESEYVDSLEKLILSSEQDLAFGGVTVERLAISDIKTSSDQNLNNRYLDYICCLTFSGPNVRAFSFVIDFNDRTETQLKLISDELKLNSCSQIETIGFVFDENIKNSMFMLKNYFRNSITFIGCAGLSHGLNSLKSDAFKQNKTLFFRKNDCILVLIQLNKNFENQWEIH